MWMWITTGRKTWAGKGRRLEANMDAAKVRETNVIAGVGAVLHVWLTLMAAGGLAGCAGMSDSVRTDYDQDVNFSQYQTFDLEAVHSDRHYDFINAMVQDALIRNLLAKGLDPALETEPDLRVRFATEVESHAGVDIEYVPTEQGIWTRYFSDPETAGRLLVNIVDMQTGEVVWKGVTGGPVDLSEDVEQTRVNQVVDQLLATFPPPSSSPDP